MVALFVWEKEYSFAELLCRLQGSFIFLDKIVCNDIKIICLGFNAGNTTVLWVTVKELSPKGEHSSCISLHSVLLKNKRGGYYDK